MLSYERRVVSALVTNPDDAQATATEAYVAGALGAMPEILRFGISGLSVALGGWAALRSIAGRRRDDAAEVEFLETHPIGLVRQWVRALRSLVLFSEQEALQLAERAAADRSDADPVGVERATP
jgi:hypothetical protein